MVQQRRGGARFPAGEAVAVMAATIDLTAPASGASCVIIEGGYERAISCGWSLNLTNKAATQYGNFDYSSFAGGYGTQTDGIYQLTGATDNGASIDAAVGLGRLDFGTLAGKHIPKMRLGVESEQPMVATISTPEHPGGYAYEGRWASGDLREQQVLPGRGLEASWFDIALANQDGADFVLATVSADVAPMTRRL